ncbi:AMP-binding protein [Actinoplanes auranticolor]|uniref:AMP-dependent acyl-CoA synthetase n=1 Tax=Actinoplanes auranticolor TaxID=47988 RepID=A0A919VJ31_9ACTN|nr:AMP-binding protein [Actinoplanes auranticolor]GIM63910.1 AMP-dependent acyl-CoA synthetase [Actinoplanes auranticolor]
MALVDYLDKGASLGPGEPCLVAGTRTMSYAEVQELSHRVAGALHRSGVRAGDSVAILSGNDPVAFSAVFGISRLGAVWCPVNPRNEAAENRALLDLFDCTCLIFQAAYAPLVETIAPLLPQVRVYVCLDGPTPLGVTFAEWTAGPPAALPAPEHPDTVMLVGTGGTTGTPKGVMLTDRNLEAMSAITLMSYPFTGRPTYLALAPLTHAAGVLCFPVMALGGRIVIMARPDVGEFLHLIEAQRVTHTFLPPTVIYLALAHPDVHTTDVSSLQCFWYGAAPMSTARLTEAIEVFGPVMGQLFGQSEAPMMISTMAPAEHLRPDGSPAVDRLGSAGHPSPLVTVAIMDGTGTLLPAGERGEIVVRGSLVMRGYYKNPAATAEASAYGWHHTGDIGYLDEDNYLFIVDRAKDMIITGGYNVYSAEVEQALMHHPSVYEAAVIGVPDEKWGERVTAVVQPVPGESVDLAAVSAFVRERVGGVKAPKEIFVWAELPRSRVGKILKGEIRDRLCSG